METDKIHDSVKDYYGKTLQSTSDLKTSACCPGAERPAKHVRDALALVHDDVISRYYGCGLVIPPELDGASVLDLGSGAGQDCFVLSKLVGQNGHVTGVDMTDEQLAVARKYIPYHTEKFGYKTENVDFRKGYLEKLDQAGLSPDSFDIVVSNCVINLCLDKTVVLKECYRILKEGGELYFSDVYADRDLPEEVRKHEVLWGECISGALMWKELYKIAEQVGFSPPRLLTTSPIDKFTPELAAVIGDAKFASVTYRLFKLPKTKSPAANAMYDGGIVGSEDSFKLDHASSFPRDTPVFADSEVVSILKSSRFRDYFTFQPATDQQTCCKTDPAKVMVNPFDLLASNPARSAGCCAPSSKSSTSAACCAPSSKKCC